MQFFLTRVILSAYNIIDQCGIIIFILITYSDCKTINLIIAITLVQGDLRCIRGSRVTTSQIGAQWPKWKYGTGMNLYQ